MFKQYTIAAAFGITGFFLGTAMAKAESFTLFERDGWSVRYVTSDVSEHCAMSKTNSSNATFHLSAHEDDTYRIGMTVMLNEDWVASLANGFKERNGWSAISATVNNWDEYEWPVSDYTTRYLGDDWWLFTTLSETFTERNSREFRAAIARGRSLSSEWDIREAWSLKGSANAMRVLDECRRRLGSF